MKKLLNLGFLKTKAMMQAQPLLTGCTISSILMGVGDSLSQIYVEGREINLNFEEVVQTALLSQSSLYTSHGSREVSKIREFEWSHDTQSDRDSLDFDYSRLGKSMAIGFFVMAPNLFLWYRKGLPMILNSKLLSKYSPFKRTLVATGIDQIAFFTYWSALYIFSEGYFSQGCPVEAYKTVQDNLSERVANNWMYWPAIVMFNLTFINPLFRTAFINVFGVGYNVGLAAKKVKL